MAIDGEIMEIYIFRIECNHMGLKCPPHGNPNIAAI